MATRILKNNTNSNVSITYGNATLIVPAQSQADLCEEFELWQLASIDYIVELLGQGISNFQLNDGASDLSVAKAIDLIRGHQEQLPKDSRGLLNVSMEKSVAQRVTIYTHDWTDKTTWYTKAIRVVNETASNDGYNTTYSLAHGYIIDTYHGKLTGEDYLKDKDGYNYRATVKVNGTTKTEQDPHYGTGGDYTINYIDGKITFLNSLNSEDAVTATYHYATTSEFILAPAAGKKLLIELADVQFSTDIEITDSVVFNPKGLVDVFAPQYLQSNGGPYPSGTKIPLSNPLVYKGIKDFQADAIRAYPKYDALGGNGWRGLNVAMWVFNWDYVRSTALYSGYGMEISLKLQHDTPFNGTYASATFYCGSESE